jgi:hypothetical protein
LSRKVHLDTLRSCDPVTLEVTVAEPLRRPLVQLSGQTIADLIALKDVEALSKSLRRGFALFADRVIPELADLPLADLVILLDELEALEPSIIPVELRDALYVESEERDEVVRARMKALVDGWRLVPPAPIVLGKGKPPVIHRVRNHDADADQAARRRERRPIMGSGSERPPREAKIPREKPVKLVDVDRVNWLNEILLERLSDYLEQGLREDVLVAGVKHRARADYPDLTPVEILTALRELQDNNRVKHSAGRWRRVIGSW